MKKEELIALGLTGEQRKAVQELHGRDILREIKKAQNRIAPQEAELRSAVVKMTYLLSIRSLQALLIDASNLYAEETTNQTTGSEPEKVEE